MRSDNNNHHHHSSILDISQLRLSGRKDQQQQQPRSSVHSSSSKRKSSVAKKVNEIKQAFKNKMLDRQTHQQSISPQPTFSLNNDVATERQDLVRFMVPVIAPRNNLFCSLDKPGFIIGESILYQYQINSVMDDSAWPIYCCYEASSFDQPSQKLQLKIYSFEHMHEGLNEISKWMYLHEQGLYEPWAISEQSHGFLLPIQDFFIYKNRLVIVTKIKATPLQKYKGRLSTDVTRDVVRKLLECVRTLNQHNLMHLNLNLDTVLLRKPANTVVLNDLSLSQNKARENKPIRDPNIVSSVYTGYWSPETLLKVRFIIQKYKINIDQKSDIWSIGCILFELYTERPLITVQLEPKEIVYVIKKSLDLGASAGVKVKQSRKASKSVSNMSSLMHKENHSDSQEGYISGNNSSIKVGTLDKYAESIVKQLQMMQKHDEELHDLVTRMLTINPTKRIGVEEALAHKWL